MDFPVPDHIRDIRPYVAGKPIEELEREHGIRDSVKLASNENPLGPSPKAMEAVNAALAGLHRYPDAAGYELTGAIASHLGVAPEKVVLGNGSDDLIGMLTRALLVPGSAAVLPAPSFLMYEISVRSAGARPVTVPLSSSGIHLEGMLEALTPETRMIFLCNPNNPTGTVISRSALRGFLDRVPEGVVVVIDEAYIEFARDPECAGGIEEIDRGRPVAVLRTFSKAYGLAGLRIGYGVMPEELSGVLHRIRQPFNAGLLAQVGARAALGDTAFLERTLRTVHEGLDFLYRAVEGMGLRYFPSQANFFMIDTGRSADEVFERLLRHGVIVRSMTSYGYPRYIRVSAGTPEENRRFVRALEQVVHPGAGAKGPERK